MPLLDLSAAMAAFRAALFVAMASAKPENFPCYSSHFPEPYLFCRSYSLRNLLSSPLISTHHTKLLRSLHTDLVKLGHFKGL